MREPRMDLRQSFQCRPRLIFGNRNVGIARLLRDTGEERLRIYCIFDRDYRDPSELANRVERAKEEGIDMHIWRRKEIENYLVCPSAVHRLIASSIQRAFSQTVDDVAFHIDGLIRSLEGHTVELIASEIQRRHKGIELQAAMRLARVQIDERWKSEEGRLSLVSGKEVLARISEWAKDRFGVSITTRRILRELRLDEIAAEMTAVVSAIDDGDPLIEIAQPASPGCC